MLERKARANAPSTMRSRRRSNPRITTSRRLPMCSTRSGGVPDRGRAHARGDRPLRVPVAREYGGTRRNQVSRRCPQRAIVPGCRSGEWRNWQTRWLQVPVAARSWGFKSPLAHRVLAGQLRARPATSADCYPISTVAPATIARPLGRSAAREALASERRVRLLEQCSRSVVRAAGRRGKGSHLWPSPGDRPDGSGRPDAVTRTGSYPGGTRTNCTSIIGFAFCELGFRLLAPLKRIGSVRLYRSAGGSTYQALESSAERCGRSRGTWLRPN